LGQPFFGKVSVISRSVIRFRSEELEAALGKRALTHCAAAASLT
jgi:hypothetical protein